MDTRKSEVVGDEWDGWGAKYVAHVNKAWQDAGGMDRAEVVAYHRALARGLGAKVSVE